MAHDRKEHELRGYEKMLERVKSLMETPRQMKLGEAVTHAKERAVELEELTRSEAERIGDYIRRDIQDAARYMAESDQDLGAWFQMDLALVESWLWDTLTSVADKTKLEMLQFQESLQEYSKYYTGEVTGPGELKCVECGKVLHFHETGHIPPCSECSGTTFERPSGK